MGRIPRRQHRMEVSTDLLLGLGTVRTIAAFQQTVGVDYTKKQIHPAAIRGCRNAACYRVCW